jgi:SAM-dependent methyltransferase
MARQPPGSVAPARASAGLLDAPRGNEAVFDRIPRSGGFIGRRALPGGRLRRRQACLGASWAEALGAAELDHRPDICSRSAANATQRRLSTVRLSSSWPDAAPAPWPDSTFSVALSANTLFFIERPQQVLAELHRVLAPGGRAFIATVPDPLPAPSLRSHDRGFAVLKPEMAGHERLAFAGTSRPGSCR